MQSEYTNVMAGVLAVGEKLIKCTIRLDTEKNAQADIEQVFIEAMIPFKREYSLSKFEFPDFMVDDCIAVEVKIKGSAKEIYKQLVRYAGYDKTKAIILVTNKQMKLPETINGKFTHIINLGKGWL